MEDLSIQSWSLLLLQVLFLLLFLQYLSWSSRKTTCFSGSLYWSIVLFLFAFALKIKRMILNGRSVWETKFFTPRNKKSQLMVEKLIVTFSLFPVTLVKLVRSVKSALLLHTMRKNNHLIIAAGKLYSAWIM